MIKVGSTEITNILVGSTAIAKVAVRPVKVFPTDVTHTLTNITVAYSTSTYLYPRQTNFAYITGSWNTYRDSTYVSSTTVTCTPYKVTSSDPIIIGGTNIQWDKDTYGKSIVAQTTCSIKATYGGITADTSVIAGQNKVESTTWSNPSIDGFAYGRIGAAGGDSLPTVSVSQSGYKTYTSLLTASTSNTSFSISYAYDGTGNFTLQSTTTGQMHANSKGVTVTGVTTSGTITMTVIGQGLSTTGTATVEQGANAIISTTWDNPYINTFVYGVILASGGTMMPTTSYWQTGIVTYTSQATAETYNYDDFELSFTYDGTAGFVLNDTSTGQMSAATKGTTITGITTSGTITMYVTGNGKSSSATSTVTQAANKIISEDYEYPTVSVSYPSAIAPGGGSVYPTKSASQYYVKTYSSQATSRTEYTSFVWTFSYDDTGNFSLISATTGQMSATTKGAVVSQVTTSGTISVTVTGGGSKSTGVQTYVTQAANYIASTDWENPIISTFTYPNAIPASGGTSSPYVDIIQYGTNYYSSSSTARTSTIAVNRSYSYSSSGTGDRFSLSDATNGMMSATTNTATTVATSGTITLTATGNGKSSTKTAKVTQAAGVYSMIWTYNGTVINDGDDIDADVERIVLIDTGINNHDYTINVTGGQLEYDVSGNKIVAEIGSSLYGVVFTLNIIESEGGYHEQEITFTLHFDG